MKCSKIKAFWLLPLWPAHFWGTSEFSKVLRIMYLNSPCESKMIYVPCEQKRMFITIQHRLYFIPEVLRFPLPEDNKEPQALQKDLSGPWAQCWLNSWNPSMTSLRIDCPVSIRTCLVTGNSQDCSMHLFCCLIGKNPFLILNRNLSPCNKSAFSVPDAVWRTEDRIRPFSCSSYDVITSPSKSQILCSSEVWPIQNSQPHSSETCTSIL